MFFREAEQGPSQQELATMTAPFGGSVEQARALMTSPAMQQHLQQYGIHFDPNQVRRSPFLPNAFMGSHPLLGGALSNAMANAAATPEAPLVSGAGSGISRAMQGMYGGPELQRQYQVRQIMAPFQAMGMQLPVRAEERRQQLLESIQQDLASRRGIEAKMLPEQLEIKRQMAEAAAARAEAAGNVAQAQMIRAQAQAEYDHAKSLLAQTPTPTPYGLRIPGAGLQITHPEGMPAELGGQVSTGGPRFEPYGPDVIANLVAAHPERKSLADWREALLKEGYAKDEVELLAAKAMEAQGKGAEARAKAAGGAGAKGGWTPKESSKLEGTKAREQQAIEKEYAPIKEKYKDNAEWQQKDPNSFNNYMSRLQHLEDQYTEAGRALGGTYPGYTYPGMRSSVAPQNPFVSPGAPPQRPTAPTGPVNPY
jgi:hypothetical protein